MLFPWGAHSADVTCERGYYLPHASTKCEQCPENSYCPGGKYTYSENNDTGINTCPDGLVAPVGMWEAAQCGRRMHVKDGVFYLRQTKGTSPSLAFDVNSDGVADYYVGMSASDLSINKDTNYKMKFKYKDVVYSVHDDTVDASSSN